MSDDISKVEETRSKKLFPGDDLVQNPIIELTYRIEINGDPAEIWPWLVQVGYHRGGWYIDKWSDRIEQQYFWPLLVPKEARGTWMPPANEILPEFQGLKAGDSIPDGPPGSAYYEVVDLVENERMILIATTHLKYMAPQFVQGTRFEPKGKWSWAFILKPLENGKTSLMSRWRGEGEPVLYLKFLKPFIILIDHHQQNEILKGIKRRVEKE